MRHFYSYDEKEEVNEERFNRFINLGINAEDMENILKEKDGESKLGMIEIFTIHIPFKKRFKRAKM